MTAGNPFSWDAGVLKRITIHTAFLRCSLAHKGIHDAFNGHRSDAFVLTLFTFYGTTEVNDKEPLEITFLSSLHTCPPGPELRANVNWTAALGIWTDLKDCIHSRACAFCAAFSSAGSGGGVGSGVFGDELPWWIARRPRETKRQQVMRVRVRSDR